MAAIAPDPTESAARGWLGSFVETWEPGTGAPIEDSEPATGRLIATVQGSTPDDVARAAAAAAAAQPAWAATSYQERARILRRAADIYEAHRDEFGEWTQRETGASQSKMHHESTFAYHEILNAATLPSQAYGSLMPTAVKGRLSMVRRVPVGVVGAITPWNSPSVLGMRVVAPALALGNAVVLKPDPQTPVVGGAMFAAVFAEAGLPDGLLQVVVGGADVGEALVTDPAIPVVSFTGSTAVGRRVGQLAGGMLKKVSLELGGNNAFIVLDDADLDAAAAAGAFSAFQFQGQVCFAAGRHLVHHSLAEAYTSTLAQKAKRLRTGDPFREEVQLG
ncbi:MAG TPA: aldehyde dehydrogenase family protein, partial [Candidatus Limnocylindrales bacterium]